jgi:hypothetical protein
MVRPACPLPYTAAHQPNLVAQKTHFGIIALAFRPGLLSRLVGFQIQFLMNDFEN